MALNDHEFPASQFSDLKSLIGAENDPGEKVNPRSTFIQMVVPLARATTPPETENSEYEWNEVGHIKDAYLPAFTAKAAENIKVHELAPLADQHDRKSSLEQIRNFVSDAESSPLFTIKSFGYAGEKPVVIAEVIRVGIIRFQSTKENRDDSYLVLMLRSPTRVAEDPETGREFQAWTLGELISINYAIAGTTSDSAGDSSEERSKMRPDGLDPWEHMGSWEMFQGYGECQEVSSAASGLDSVLNSLLSSPMEKLTGPFKIDGRLRYVSITVAACSGLSRGAGIQLAEHLGACFRQTDPTSQPLGTHATDEVLPEALYERGQGSCYYSTQRALGLVIYPADEIERHEHWQEEVAAGLGDRSAKTNLYYPLDLLPVEFQTETALLCMLVMYQGRELDRLIKKLGRIKTGPVVEPSEDSPSTEKRKAPQAPTKEEKSLKEWNKDLTKRAKDRSKEHGKLQEIEVEFFQLQTLMRVRLVSPRFGSQSMYSHVLMTRKINEIYSDVSQIVQTLEGYLRSDLSKLQEIQRELFEYRVQMYGVIFAIVALAIGIFGVRISGIFDGGFPIWFLAVVVILACVVGYVAVDRMRRDHPKTRHPGPEESG